MDPSCLQSLAKQTTKADKALEREYFLVKLVHKVFVMSLKLKTIKVRDLSFMLKLHSL